MTQHITERDILAAEAVRTGVRERMRAREEKREWWRSCSLCGKVCTRYNQFGVCDACYEGEEETVVATDIDEILLELGQHLEWAEMPNGKHAWHYDGVALVDDWNGCTAVNPMCPDDLCILPYGHPGMAEGVHHLGTSAEPYHFPGIGLHPRGPNAKPWELVDLGWKRQKEQFPKDSQWQADK